MTNDPVVLLQACIHAFHDDASMMHAGEADDARWGLEILVANIIVACEQNGVAFSDIAREAAAGRREWGWETDKMPDYSIHRRRKAVKP